MVSPSPGLQIARAWRSLKCQFLMQAVDDRPADYSPRRRDRDHSQAEPALIHPHVQEIRGPLLVRTLGREVPLDEIRCDRESVMLSVVRLKCCFFEGRSSVAAACRPCASWVQSGTIAGNPAREGTLSAMIARTDHRSARRILQLLRGRYQLTKNDQSFIIVQIQSVRGTHRDRKYCCSLLATRAKSVFSYIAIDRKQVAPTEIVWRGCFDIAIQSRVSMPCGSGRCKP